MTTKKAELADPHGKGFMSDKDEAAKYTADRTAAGVDAWKEGMEGDDPCRTGFVGVLPSGFYDLKKDVDWCQPPVPGWQPTWDDINYMEKLGVGWFLKKWDLYPKCDKDPESFAPKDRWKSWDGTLSPYGRALQCIEEYQKRGWDPKAKSKPWLTAPGAKSPGGLGSGVPRGPVTGSGGGLPHVLGAAGPMGAFGAAGDAGAGAAGAEKPCCCCCPKPKPVTYSGSRTQDPMQDRLFLSRPGGTGAQTLSGQPQGSFATPSFMQSAARAATQALTRAAEAATGGTHAQESTSASGTEHCCDCCGPVEEPGADSDHPGTTTVPEDSEDRPGTEATGEETTTPFFATAGKPLQDSVPVKNFEVDVYADNARTAKKHYEALGKLLKRLNGLRADANKARNGLKALTKYLDGVPDLVDRAGRDPANAKMKAFLDERPDCSATIANGIAPAIGKADKSIDALGGFVLDIQKQMESVYDAWDKWGPMGQLPDEERAPVNHRTGAREPDFQDYWDSGSSDFSDGSRTLPPEEPPAVLDILDANKNAMLEAVDIIERKTALVDATNDLASETAKAYTNLADEFKIEIEKAKYASWRNGFKTPHAVKVLFELKFERIENIAKQATKLGEQLQDQVVKPLSSESEALSEILDQDRNRSFYECIEAAKKLAADARLYAESKSR